MDNDYNTVAKLIQETLGKVTSLDDNELESKKDSIKKLLDTSLESDKPFYDKVHKAYVKEQLERENLKNGK